MNKYKKAFFGLLFAMGGCATSEKVQLVQLGDHSMTCDEIQAEMKKLDDSQAQVEDKKGVNGTNVAAAVAWLPGLVYTYYDASKANDAITARRSHLTELFDSKACKVRKVAVATPAGVAVSADTAAIPLAPELKRLHDAVDQATNMKNQLSKSLREKLSAGEGKKGYPIPQHAVQTGDAASCYGGWYRVASRKSFSSIGVTMKGTLAPLEYCHDYAPGKNKDHAAAPYYAALRLSLKDYKLDDASFAKAAGTNARVVDGKMIFEF